MLGFPQMRHLLLLLGKDTNKRKELKNEFVLIFFFLVEMTVLLK